MTTLPLFSYADVSGGYIEAEDAPIFQKHECQPTHRWNADSQNCEIWRNSVYVVIILIVIVTVAAFWCFTMLKQLKTTVTAILRN